MALAMSCLLPSTASVMGYLKTGEWGGVGFEQTPSGSATDCIMDLLVTIATDLQRTTRRAFAIQPIVQLTTALQFFAARV